MANQYNDILASQIAEPATSDENLELYTQVVAGDTFARQEMIERNMALVLSKVDSFVASRPSVKYLRDDLVSMGSIGLVNAVNTMAAGTAVENPTGYLGAAIVYELQHLFETEDPIPVSRRSLHRGEENGDSSPGLERVSSTHLEHCSTNENTPGIVELRDLLESCCTTQRDRACLRLLEEGHSREEIGRILGISKSYAIKLCRRIEDCFLAKEAELRGTDALPQPICKKREPSSSRLRFSL